MYLFGTLREIKEVIVYSGIVISFEVFDEYILILSIVLAMAVDTALLATLEGPDQFQTLSQAVENNPEDFNSWTQLLSKLDEQVYTVDFTLILV